MSPLDPLTRVLALGSAIALWQETEKGERQRETERGREREGQRERERKATKKTRRSQLALLYSHAQVVRVSLGGRLSSDNELPPCLVAFVHNLDCVLFGLGLSREGKDIFGLSIRDLVDPEPFVGRSDETGEVPLDILNVVEAGCEGVVDVDDEDLE